MDTVPTITKILVLQEKLTNASTFISNFLTIHQSDLSNQPVYNSILNEVKSVIKWTDGTWKSHVKLKIYIYKVLKYSLAEDAAFNIRP